MVGSRREDVVGAEEGGRERGGGREGRGGGGVGKAGREQRGGVGNDCTTLEQPLLVK